MTATKQKTHKPRYNTDPSKKAKPQDSGNPNKLFDLGVAQGIMDGYKLRQEVEKRAELLQKRAETAEAELKFVRDEYSKSAQRVTELHKTIEDLKTSHGQLVYQARQQERQQRVREADRLSTSLASLRAKINEATELAMAFRNSWQGEIIATQTQDSLESLHAQAVSGPKRR